MSEEKKKIVWVKYLLGGLLLILVLLVVFCQPIILGIIQLAVQESAKSQGVALQFKIHGSIVSDISIEDLHLQPLPQNNNLPVERVDVKRIAARYNVFSLFKKDFLNVVELVELKDADVVVHPSFELLLAKEKPVDGSPKIAIIVPKKIDIQNVNVTVRGNKGDIVVRKFAVAFQQGQTGYLFCKHIDIPAIAEWNNVRAGLDYQNNQIHLTDLTLDPILDLHQLQIDLSKAENRKISVHLDAAVLEAPVSATASYSQKGRTTALDAMARLSNLNLEKIQKIAPVPVSGTLRQGEIALNGDINRPNSISGQINVDASDLRYQSYRVEQAKVAVGIDQGQGTIQEVSVHSGRNRIWAGGNFQLAEKLEEIVTQSSASIGLAVSVLDPDAYTPGIKVSTLAQGSIQLQNRKAQAFLESATAGISVPASIPGLNISTVHTNLFTVIRLPIKQNLWPSLAAVVLGGINNIDYQNVHVSQVLLHGEATDGKNTNLDTVVHSGTSSIRVTGACRLPTKDQPFDFKEVEGRLRLNIASLSDFIREQTPGTFTAKGDVQIADLQPTGSITATGHQIKYRGLPVQDLKLDTRFEENEAKIQVAKIDFDRNNYVQLGGRISLANPFSYETRGEVRLDLSIFNEALNTLGQNTGLVGHLATDWWAKGDGKNIIPQGEFKVVGNHIKYRGLTIQGIDINATLANQKLDLPNLKVMFNEKNFIDAKANAVLSDPYLYNADTKVEFQDLGFLNELVKSFGQDLGLGGKLVATWNGKGEVKNSIGNIEVHADGIKTKSIQGVEADLIGNYQGLNAEIPRLQVATPYANLDTSIRLTPEFLEIPALTISKNGNTIVGNVKVPVRLDAKTPLNLDGPLDINIRADKISLASLQSTNPQVTGTVDLQIQASKTLRDPFVEISTTARDIRVSSLPSLQGANSDFLVQLADKVLSVSGKVQQSDINPVEITGRAPLDAVQIIQDGSLPDGTPLAFSVKWPNNNLAFIRKIVPDIKIIEGTTNVDVNVAGTVKHPELTGGVYATVSRFQAKTDTVPPLADFVMNISLRDNQLQIDQLKGLAGGGPFEVNGVIDLADGKNPKFDIGVNGKQVLLTRSDGLIARSNVALKIQGPLSAGEVSGHVGVTNSRFFKEIDILPLNLPGRPSPQPPPGVLPKISIDTPPFKDWKFNIAIRTDDPILIQSNLARGHININLQAGGTGAAPSVTGFIRVDHLVASLPSSKMEITNGTINFAQGGNPLDPGLSIIGHSAVRDYEVRARIFGTATNPTVVLDSSPPLAEGDILALLATGSTASEFAQNPELLAGRASFIMLEQLLRRFFPHTNRADEQKEPLTDRFDVEVIPGRKTGEQEISTHFKLTENWQIIGDIGTSSYQGRLKYLIRFR